MAPNTYDDQEDDRQIWNWLTGGGTTDPVSTPPSVAIGGSGAGTSNVAVTKIGSTAVDSNSGTKSAGTLRVVLATDQPTLTSSLLPLNAGDGSEGIATAKPGVVPLFGDATVWRKQLVAHALSDGNTGVNITGVTALRANNAAGTSFDFERGNSDVTVFASAARTSTPTPFDGTNYNGRGLHLVIDCTAVSGSSSVVFTIQGKDAVSGKFYTILASAAIVGTGTTVLRVFPGLTAAGNLVVSDTLPRTWRVIATHGTADSTTYSVGASVIV